MNTYLLFNLLVKKSKVILSVRNRCFRLKRRTQTFAQHFYSHRVGSNSVVAHL
nr:MAG TPA: hypothetical protein [Bacteriophage sp.]